MASSVTFPLSESPQKQSKVSPPFSRPPHLPFRRISLPTAPSIAHRESVFSIISVDSLPEDDDGQVPPPTRAAAVIIGGVKTNGEGRGTRQISIESPRKRKRTRESTSRPPGDDKHLMKRKRIVDEFYETEVAYVDGLDLIYNVSYLSVQHKGKLIVDFYLSSSISLRRSSAHWKPLNLFSIVRRLLLYSPTSSTFGISTSLSF